MWHSNPWLKLHPFSEQRKNYWYSASTCTKRTHWPISVRLQMQKKSLRCCCSFFCIFCHFAWIALLLSVRMASQYAHRFLPLYIPLKWVSSCLLLNGCLLLMFSHFILPNVKLLSLGWDMNSLTEYPVGIACGLYYWRLLNNNSVNYLSVTFSSDLSWSFHVSLMSNKVFRLIYYIKRLYAFGIAMQLVE